MAVITLPYKYLERLTRTDKKTILDKVPLIGSDVERIVEDHADVEFFPDRPDLFSPEGVARAMRGFLGIETGLPVYPVKPSGIKFTVDPALAEIRPVLGAAVIQDVSFDDESIQSIKSTAPISEMGIAVIGTRTARSDPMKRKMTSITMTSVSASVLITSLIASLI